MNNIRFVTESLLEGFCECGIRLNEKDVEFLANREGHGICL